MEKEIQSEPFSQRHATQLLLKLFESSKESVEELVDVLPLVYCIANSRGEVVRGNKDLGKILNVSFERLIGENLRKIFSSEGWDTITFAIRDALSNGKNREVMVPIESNGQKRFYLWSFVRFSRLPNLDLVTMIGQDITEAELGLRRVKRLNELLDKLIVTSQKMMDSASIEACFETALETLLSVMPENAVNFVELSISLPNRKMPLLGSSRRPGSDRRNSATWQIKIEWAGYQVGFIVFDCSQLDDRELLKFVSLLGQSTYLTLSHLSFQREMEEKIVQGTLEIAQLNAGLSALLNSLSDGYAVFNLKGDFLAISSRRMQEFCGGDVTGKNFTEVFNLAPDEKSQFKDWLRLAASEALPFDDLAKLCPTIWFYPPGKDLKINLAYHPIRNEAGLIEKIAIVATDRTAQLTAEARAADESDKSYMVLRILEDILSFEEAWLALTEFADALEVRNGNKETMSRKAHTLKSSFGYFGMEQVAQLLNDFESEYSKSDFVDLGKWSRAFKLKMSDFFGQYPQIFSFMASAQGQKLSANGDTQVIDILNSTNSVEELRNKISDHLFFHPIDILIEPTLKRFKSRASAFGLSVDLRTTGLDARVWASRYRPFFSSLEHLFNNIVDHGLTTKTIPNFTGVVTLSVISTPTEFKIKISDNGSGIDVERLLEKAKQSGVIMNSELVANPLNLIFLKGISTRDSANMFSGRGVGMEVVAHELSLLNGQVNVKSVWGTGTEFEFTLPRLLPL